MAIRFRKQLCTLNYPNWEVAVLLFSFSLSPVLFVIRSPGVEVVVAEERVPPRLRKREEEEEGKVMMM
jgi:hypothetical protein